MDGTDNNQTATAKRDYEKPSVHRIDLVAAEVLSVGCKETSPGPHGDSCMAIPCNNEGS